MKKKGDYNMKRLIALILVAAMAAVLFVGCGVSEEFKAKMDAYEDDAKALVECKEKLDEKPEDLELIAEFAELSLKNTANLAELEAMDQEEMDTAEKAYYTKVLASVTEKVTSVVMEEAG